MEIIHELNQLDFGGAERVVRNIVKYDDKNNHTIISYQDGPFREELERVGANVIVLTDKDELDCSVDLVHIHTGGNISNLARRIKGHLKVIETIHSPVRSPMFNHEITQRVGVCDAVSRINHNCITIKNGLDFEDLGDTEKEFDVRQKFGIPEDAFVIGRLGRVGYDKGLEEWILACWELQNRGHNFVPMIVGHEAGNANGYIGKLKLMCESLPLKNVVWTGGKRFIKSYLEAMNLFLYPSMTEGFGLVIAEAMYSNVPVITYNNDVNRELFGGYSYLVDPKSGVKGLADATERLMNNPHLQSEFTGSPYEFVLDQYSADRMSAQYQELYERCNGHSELDDRPQEEHAVSS